MKLLQITLPKGFISKSVSLIQNSNKLQNTINILSNKIIIKQSDLNICTNLLRKNNIPFKYSSL
jgi:hypothetical protein